MRFVRKESITLKALRQYNAYNPAYFPVKGLQILADCFAPYFTLWMSSEIVTVLYEGKTRKEVWLLVAAALAGNLLLRIASAMLKRSEQTQLEILQNREAAAFNAKTLSLDYAMLEDPAIRQLRRKIIENSWINAYGVVRMRYVLESAMESLVNLVFSLALFLEMLSLIALSGLTLTTALLLAVLAASIALNMASTRRQIDRITEEERAVGECMLDENRIGRGYTPSGMDNRIYRQQPLITQMLKPLNQKHLKVFSSLFRADFRLSIPVSAAEKLSELCAYLIICLYCALGAFPVGSVIKYVGYLNKMTASISTLFRLGQECRTNEPFLTLYLDYFALPSQMKQGGLPVQTAHGVRLEVKDVSFRYTGTGEDALKHVSLNLNPGEKLAVVGVNGSGKTTLIKLLCRLYDPTQGTILLNGTDVRQYDYSQYLNLFSVVFQDYKLLSVPLGNNVSSAAAWDSGMAVALLEKAGFGERLSRLPRGLETPLYKHFDEDGVNLSGGEAQKVALARALYKDAPIMILDEPTAALDPIAESEIYTRFNDIAGDKTVVYISHRLSSCRFCDRIAVFDHGELVQLGTHNELLSDADGRYFELWNAQAQYYTRHDSQSNCHMPPFTV